jgi:hypothetical protein
VSEAIKLSTGKLCPRCGCQSLEEYWTEKTMLWDKTYNCVAMCGMMFSLSRLKNHRIKIGYHKGNENYLAERFKIKLTNPTQG